VIRRIALLLALVAGLFWAISPFALNYPGKTSAVEQLTTSFRPVFSDAGVTQANADRATIDSFSADFQNKALPALATQLNLTPTQLVATLGTQYPAVQKGLAQLPATVTYVDHLLDEIQVQQHNFQQADAIPTSNLPNTAVTWIFVIPGILVSILALAGLFRPKAAVLGLAGVLVIGIVMIVGSFVIAVPSKTQAADNLDNAFRPLFTTAGVAQAQGYLHTTEAMQTQLATQALPGIAVLLKQTPAEFAGQVSTQFPTVAAGLIALPGVLSRLDHLIGLIDTNVHNFQLSDSIPTTTTPTTLIQAQIVVPATVLILAGLLGIGPAVTKRVLHRDFALDR
jgi:hypothetical protein